jgi:hypothetical protein
MKLKHISYLLVLSFFLTSCFAVHSGMMTSSTALNQPNFTYVKKNVQGKATASYFLGIGGLKVNAVVQSAKEDLIKSTPLKENQALANVVVDIKVSNTFFGIINTYTCFVSADIVEFHK